MTNRATRLAALIIFAAALVLTLSLMRSQSPAQNPPRGGGGQRPNPFDTGGRDDKPAGEVFKNIQVLKALPAGRLGGVMGAMTRSLGVRCEHCHIEGQFDKDDVPAKQVAREMVRMTGTINNDLLKGIKGLKSETPQVSCYTCHRGSVKPETELPPRQPAAPPK
jgi:photosynthetic reaction center cytochrome c subunit